MKNQLISTIRFWQQRNHNPGYKINYGHFSAIKLDTLQMIIKIYGSIKEKTLDAFKIVRAAFCPRSRKHF